MLYYEGSTLLSTKLGSTEDFKDTVTVLNFCLEEKNALEAEKDNILREMSLE